MHFEGAREAALQKPGETFSYTFIKINAQNRKNGKEKRLKKAENKRLFGHFSFALQSDMHYNSRVSFPYYVTN